MYVRDIAVSFLGNCRWEQGAFIIIYDKKCNTNPTSENKDLLNVGTST